MTTRIAVLGAGSWGTALALHLTAIGHRVTLWVRRPEACEGMVATRTNTPYLPGFVLSDELRLTADLEEALAGAETILSAVPAQHTRAVWQRVAPILAAASGSGSGTVALSATKGIELGSLKRMSEVIAETLGPSRLAIASISGPTFAREVAAGEPSAAVVACADLECAARVQRLFSSPRLRVYRSADIVGVECAGAFKNVIAIAAGIVDGLGFGHNARAALVTRGLHEMARLGMALGGQMATFSGLAGMGDLILTATGDLSRNRQVGLRLGRGETLAAIESGMTMVAEGVKTCAATAELARRHAIEMPIVNEVNAVVYTGKDPRQALHDLMTRELKAEDL